jgi:hypothetical protein
MINKEHIIIYIKNILFKLLSKKTIYTPRKQQLRILDFEKESITEGTRE